jgi:hypothetical protein
MKRDVIKSRTPNQIVSPESMKDTFPDAVFFDTAYNNYPNLLDSTAIYEFPPVVFAGRTFARRVSKVKMNVRCFNT